MSEGTNARRVIAVNRSVIGPAAPRAKTVRPRKLDDYPHVSPGRREVARKLSNPLLVGPPICDELLDLVEHLFTEEEADCVRHLGLARGRRATDVARRAHRPVDDVRRTLDRLADDKRLILADGPGDRRRYSLLPVMPGMFEMSLIGADPQHLTPWQQGAAERFERLYDTGYVVDYQRPGTAPLVRYLPVGKAIEAQSLALPTDRLEALLDRYDVFGVGNCQCRISAQAVGRGCGKPTRNCLVMGQWALRGIESGQLQQVERREALELKREAEAHGMIHFSMNVASAAGQCSCSCCGCCCKALRTINDFNAPSLFAPPHFVPHRDEAKCNACGLCARRCPMGAITVDAAARRFDWNAARCVGCGQCVVACSARRALSMAAAPDHRLPYRSWFSYIFRGAPGFLGTAWRVWRGR